MTRPFMLLAVTGLWLPLNLMGSHDSYAQPTCGEGQEEVAGYRGFQSEPNTQTWAFVGNKDTGDNKETAQVETAQVNPGPRRPPPCKSVPAKHANEGDKGG